MTIDGRTRPAGLVGWPIERSLSPAMHNAAYDALGFNWVYLPFPIKDGAGLVRFIDAVRSLPFVGFNVTMPHKQAMLGLCDEVALFAQMAGAVNTVHCVDDHLIGYNTDGRGLIEALETEAAFNAEGKRVALIGAGGAAGAAMVALVLAKAAHVTVINRDESRAQAMLERMEGYMRQTTADVVALNGSASAAVSSADLVINATPVGMKADDPSPVPTTWFAPGQVVCDMVYQQPSTALLAGAAAAGASTVGGLSMLVAQGALAIDIWSESAQTSAPRDVMRAAAEEAFGKLLESGGAQ
ncbi:MAG: shikimate dehydrogenase [Coriobacteriales bacterium]